MVQLRLSRSSLPILVAAVAGLAVFAIGASLTGPFATSTLEAGVVALVRDGSVAILWIAMAFGFGTALVQGLGLRSRRSMERIALSGALGTAAALIIDSLIGTLPIPLVARGLGAWAVTIAGLVLLVVHVRARPTLLPRLRPSPVIAATGLAIGILFLAAVSEPGWLWRSEFGGYDALSYHLQLPKEWLAAGGISTLEHNVYSAFPSFVEAAFLHLFLLAGGPERGAIAAQCLAAFLTILSALTVGCLGHRLGGRVGAALAAAFYLGTPWIIVVGSLAYNDGVVPLFLAAGVLVVMKPPRKSWQLGAVMGLLFGAACGSKLTASGFLVAPLIAVVAYQMRWRAIAPLLCALVVATITLAPWLIRNSLATGNPTFPFLTGLFGSGHWTAEQVATFAAGHRAGDGDGFGLGRLWTQWFVFGFGAAPVRDEPWAPQWSLLPWIGIAGIAFLALDRRRRGWAITLAILLFVQLAFWLVATHLQSRFLVPTAVPLAAAAAGLARAVRRDVRVTVATIAAMAACILPAMVFRSDGPAIGGSDAGATSASVAMPSLAIGAAATFSGESTRLALLSAQSDRERAEIMATAMPPFYLNVLLPKDAKVLLLGDASPFWYRRSRETMTYATVWDRGPLSAIAARNPDHPEHWAGELDALGYRYVLVNEAMLRNWSAKGWLDPNLTPDRLGRFLTTTNGVQRFANGSLLVAIAPTGLPAPSK